MSDELLNYSEQLPDPPPIEDIAETKEIEEVKNTINYNKYVILVGLALVLLKAFYF